MASRNRLHPSAADPLEAVARVAAAKRKVLMRVYSGRLTHDEDLEDCYSQATLELLIRARRTAPFHGDAHIANALEQKLVSRIHDRRRALAGRSAAESAQASALRLGDGDGDGVEIADPRARTEDVVAARLEFRRLMGLARTLTRDHRLVLACELQLEHDTHELAARLGWSREKYRKVAQRGRRRLLRLAQEPNERAGRCLETRAVSE